MDITLPMVAYLVEKRFGAQFASAGDETCTLESVRSYHGQGFIDGTLYVAQDAPAAERAAASARTAGAACAFAAPTSDDGSTDAAALLERIASAYAELLAWDSALKDVVIEGLPLQRLIDASESIFDRPFTFVERDLTVLATSRAHQSLEPPDDHTVEGGAPLLAKATIQRLVEDDEYFEVGRIGGKFYYPISAPCTSFGINYLGEDGTWAYRLIFAIRDTGVRFSAGEEQLAQRLFDALIQACSRSSHGLMHSQSDSLHAVVRALVEGADRPTPDAISSALRFYGWHHDDELTVVSLAFFEGAGWESASEYLCRQLEREWRNSVAITTTDGICWVFNHGLSGRRLGRRELMGLVVDLIREHACKAGVSNACTKFAQLPEHFLEAQTALRIGSQLDPHFWYFLFGDYALDCLLQEATTRFAPLQLAHRGLLRLRAYDAEHGTELAPTLIAYLRHQQNAVHASDALYIHRTTLIRRLQKIEEVAGIDLLDADDCAYLLLSARLLDDASVGA